MIKHAVLVMSANHTEVEYSPDPVHSPVDAELPETHEELGGLGVLDVLPSKW